jgi:hypothetical protein
MRKYQNFLVGMMTSKDAALVKADIAKLAAKYSVPIEWAKMSVDCWLKRSAA